MPLYVDEVEAKVTPVSGPSAAGEHGLKPDQFRALVDAVAQAIDERHRREAALRADAAITGRNRPPSVGD